jgi:hypothetical protein
MMNSWVKMTAMPYKIFRHSSVSYKNKIYLFGGEISTEDGDLSQSKITLKFDGTLWESGPEMINFRHGHKSIVLENMIFHIGGFSENKVERWVFNGNDLLIDESFPYLDKWIEPSAFLVPDNYYLTCNL